MEHTQDDGRISIFAGKDEILIACNKGHFWILTAKQESLPPRVNRHLQGESIMNSGLGGTTSRDPFLFPNHDATMAERFGEGAVSFLRKDSQ
ncbi:hypothetical protein [Tessaracoccus antarcticus]|nr:hypothetical protein [Tessaracoccus antarcticus]